MARKSAIKGSFKTKKIKDKADDKTINVTKDGPYLVSGKIPLDKQTFVIDSTGYPLKWKRFGKYKLQKSYSLCRCGHSKSKPFCDGSHIDASFDGTEMASFEKYSKLAKKTNGPALILSDAEDFCSSAKFCDRKSGTWNLTKHSDEKTAKKLAIEQACNCPSGRLVIYDKKTKKTIEPNFKPEISITQDPLENVSGPIFVKGQIQIISADGKKYEKRNRVALCRCGHSKNKPLCNGFHIMVGFNDGEKK